MEEILLIKSQSQSDPGTNQYLAMVIKCLAQGNTSDRNRVKTHTWQAIHRLHVWGANHCTLLCM